MNVTITPGAVARNAKTKIINLYMYIVENISCNLIFTLNNKFQ